MNSKTKPQPQFRNEAEERQFWEHHDSTEYVDWSKAERVRLPNLRPSPPSSWPGLTRPSLDPRVKPAGDGLHECLGRARPRS